ncbi:hypothetical protein D3C86_943700 [compost metagenome]
MEVGQVQQDRTVEQGVLQTQLIAVDGFRREQQRRRRSDAGLHPVHVVPERLVAARVGAVGHHAVVEAIAALDRAAEFAVVVALGDTTVVELEVGPRQTDGADQGRGQRLDLARRQRGIGQADGTADGQGIASRPAAGEAVGSQIVLSGQQALVVLRIAQAQGDIELVGDVPGVVGEDGDGLGRLAVVILHPVADAEARTGRGRQAAQATEDAHGRRPRAGDAVHRRRIGQAEARTEQQRQEGRIAGAVPVAVGAADVLTRGEDPDQPVQLVGGAGQAEFLGQVVQLEAIAAVVHTIQQVRRRVVEVHGVDPLPVPPGADRGQGGVPRGDVDVGLGREAHVFHGLGRAAVGVGRAREGQSPEAGRGGRLLAADGGDGAIGRAGADLGRDAAVFVALGIVGDQADRDIIRRQDQQLAAGGPEVLVLIVLLLTRTGAGDHVVEAVTLALGDVQAAGDLVGDRAGDRAGQTPGVEVAVGGLGVEAGREGRGLGNNVDDAGRGVLAEQGALRPLQHLDAAQFAQVAEADAVARAIDAVDDHADRAFQAGVVADRADAADTGGGRGFRLGRGDGHARRQDLQILDVAHPRAVQRFLRQGRDHDRHVLQVLFTLLGGDDDVVDRRRPLLSRGGPGEAEGDGADDGGGRRAAKDVVETHKAAPRLCGPAARGDRGDSCPCRSTLIERREFSNDRRRPGLRHRQEVVRRQNGDFVQHRSICGWKATKNGDARSILPAFTETTWRKPRLLFAADAAPPGSESPPPPELTAPIRRSRPA